MFREPVYGYVAPLGLPHTPFIGNIRVAVQVPEGVPPSIPAHVHETVEPPTAGKTGFVAGAVPAEHRFVERVVVEPVYI
jgi:hypothetical protein